MVFAVAAVVVIHAVTGGRGGPVARALSWHPLAALGVISYGVYLWHWPVIVYVTPERARVDGWVLDGLRVALTLGVAAVSYVAVERPIRRGALSGRPMRLALVGAVAVTAAAVLAGTVGTVRPAEVTVTAAGPTPDVAAAAPSGAVREAAGADSNPYRFYPASIPEGGPRILLVGDSGPMFLAAGLATEARSAGAAVASDAEFGCTPLAPEGVSRWGERVIEVEPCHHRRRATWRDLVEEFRPDVVVYYLAAVSGLVDVRLDGEWVGNCARSFDRYLAEALAEDLDVLTAGGARALLATSPMTPAASTNPTGPAAVECRAATFAVTAASRTDTAVIDLAGTVRAGGDAQVGMFRDPVHLSDAGAAYVAEWMSRRRWPRLTADLAVNRSGGSHRATARSGTPAT